MRIRYLFYLLLLTAPNFVHAQVNYVLNPSLETYTQCPYDYDQINFAKYWSSIDSLNIYQATSDGIPEYMNTCAGNNIYTGVPSNANGYKYPHTGNGMAAMMMYNISTTFYAQRDYLQGRLDQKLTAGKQYCITFYVFLEQGSAYAVNKIGAYLDGGQIDTTHNPGLPQTQYTPQVLENSIILDTVNWTKIEGNFMATGNEQFITIGTFFDNAHISAPNFNPFGMAYVTAYYFVDDISVVESDIPAYSGGTKFKAKYDSVFIGRNEIVPDCEWYRNGVLIDTLHAGFWVKDTANTTYVVKQSICGNVKYDTAHIMIARVGVPSVGNESVFKIYPNPAQHEITIQGVNNRSTATLAIYDFSGRVMLQQEVSFVNGEVRVPLSLAGGVYMVELVDKDGCKNIQRLSVL